MELLVARGGAPGAEHEEVSLDGRGYGVEPLAQARVSLQELQELLCASGAVDDGWDGGEEHHLKTVGEEVEVAARRVFTLSAEDGRRWPIIADVLSSNGRFARGGGAA